MTCVTSSGLAPPLVSHTTMRLTFWRTHCSVKLAEVVEAALVEIGVAGIAVLAPAAAGVHGVLEIDDHFEAVRLQAVDGLPRHQQIFFGRGFERALHVEQARLDHDDGDGNAALVAEDELHVGPLFDLGAAAARAAKESQLHGAGIDGGRARRSDR